MSKTLDAAQRIAKLQAMVDNEELSVEDIADTMEGVEMEFTDKIDAMCDLIEQAKEKAASCKARAQQYQQRQKMWENQAESIRKFLLMCISASGRKSVKTVFHTVSVRNAKDKIIITDVNKLPDEFKIPEITVKADSDAIAKKISEGETIEGVTVEPGIPSIQIR